MEWIHVRNNLHGNCPDLGSLVKLFIIRDYTPLDIQTMQYLDAMGKLIISYFFYFILYFTTDYEEWTQLIDVLWVHDTAIF